MTDKPTLKEIHEKYMALSSLEKTTDWMQDVHGIKTNRQRLSKDFKRRGYFVSAPQGWDQHDEHLWRDMTVFFDETSQFVGKLVQTAWEDILKPDLRIHYLSAAAFLASDFYEACLGTLMRNVRSLSVGHELLPDGISINDIVAGNDIYSRNYSYWVDG